MLETADYKIMKDDNFGSCKWKVISKLSGRIVGLYTTRKEALADVQKWEAQGRK